MHFPPSLESYLLSKPPNDALTPLLIHLNADSSWLILLPSFASSSFSSSFPSSSTRARKYYSILLDPWLRGTQIDLHHFLSRQTHLYKSAFQSISEIEEFISRVEELVTGNEGGKGKEREEKEGSEKSGIDLVVISAEFTDHCHRISLEELKRDTNIWASDKAASLIRSWNHFEKVVEIPLFDSSSMISTYLSKDSILPDWLRISRIVAKNEPLYFHSAISILFDSLSLCLEESTTETTESRRPRQFQQILFSPHGLSPSSLPRSLFHSFTSSDSVHTFDSDHNPISIKTLALLHGIDTISLLGITINLGYKNAEKLILALRGVKYWIRTHDEEKLGEGIVGWLLHRVRATFTTASGPWVEGISSKEYREIENGDWVGLEV